MQGPFVQNIKIKLYVLWLCLVVLVPLSIAQYKDVEIEIAGPWDYVPDASNANNIIVFAPITPNKEHTMIVFPGGDAGVVDDGIPAGAVLPDPGQHSLMLTGFDPARCPASPPTPPTTKLSAVPALANISSNTISAALRQSGMRFAMTLPRPCYYVSYEEARARINPIPGGTVDATTAEGSYTTWMSLHYTVPASLNSATLTITSDTTHTPTAYQIRFANSTRPPLASAVSVVMYFSAQVIEDYTCDGHSAEFFDYDLNNTWGVSGVSRLFPEMDHHRNQTGVYHYEVPTCWQPMSTSSHPQHPAMMMGGAYLFSPGRADCHKMQFNIANAIQ